MAKYSEIVALLEYFDKKTTVKPSKKSFTQKLKNKEFDPVDYLTKERNKLERFEKYLEDYKKLTKKDEKKEDKKKQFIGIEWYVIGLCSYPVFMYLSEHLPAVLK